MLLRLTIKQPRPVVNRKTLHGEAKLKGRIGQCCGTFTSSAGRKPSFALVYVMRQIRLVKGGYVRHGVL